MEDSIQNNNKYELIIDASKFADINGFTGIWTPERHFDKLGGLFPNPAIIASSLSLITKKLKLRAGSVVLPLNNPIRIVEDWSVIDNLSKGRVEISFASGWHINDFALAPDRYTNRKEIMFSEIETVKNLWKGKKLLCKNGNNHDIEINTHPKPFQEDLPIWITAIGSPETYKRAGEIGANLMTCLLDQSIEEMSEKIKIYHKSLMENGYFPKDKKIAVFMHTYLGESIESVKEDVYKPFTNYLKGTIDLLGKFGDSSDIEIKPSEMSEQDKNTLLDFAFNSYFENKALMGTVDSCKETVEKLHKIGVNEIACLIDFGLTNNKVLESLKYLSKIVEKFKRN